MNLSQFLETKFLSWQQEQGKRKTLREFAKYLNVKPQILSMWMGGDRKPNEESIKLLAKKLGPEIYDILGLTRPDPDLAYINNNWDKINPAARQAVRELLEKHIAENEKKET